MLQLAINSYKIVGILSRPMMKYFHFVNKSICICISIFAGFVRFQQLLPNLTGHIPVNFLSICIFVFVNLSQMYLYFNFYRICCSSCHQFRSEWCRSRQNLLSQKHFCIILSQRNLCISFQSTFTQTQSCSTSGHFYHTRHHKIKIIKVIIT